MLTAISLHWVFLIFENRLKKYFRLVIVLYQLSIFYYKNQLRLYSQKLTLDIEND